MGRKSSNFYQADRPEYGGADKDDSRDESGLHELDKQKLETQHAKLQESFLPKRGENPERARQRRIREQGSE